MRAIPVILASAALGAGAIGAAVRLSPASPPRASHEDWNRRAGPDSGRVAIMLDALGRTDPLVCELIGDQLGNFWNGGEHSGVGRLAGAPASLGAAKDSMGGYITDPRAINRLVAELGASSTCVRRVAAKMLGESAIPPARMNSLLADASPTVREAAAYAAGTAEMGDIRGTLERAIDDRVPAVAAMAAWAVGEIEDRASVPPLLKALRGSETRVRLAAIWALGEIEDKRVVPDLVATLRDSDPAIRAMTADVLGRLEDQAAVAPLERALASDADARV